MKKIAFTLALLSLMVVVSCSTESNVEDSKDEKLRDSDHSMLESYVVKKNVNGSYTLNYQVSDNVTPYYSQDKDENLVKLYFDRRSETQNVSKNYRIRNEQLKISFLPQDDSFSPKIQIDDDGSRGAYGLLVDYKVTEYYNEYVFLDYGVEPGVRVEKSYDEVNKVHNIRLVPDSNARETTFMDFFEKEPDGSLKVDFIQPYFESESRPLRKADYKKPRIHISMGGHISSELR